MENEQTLNLRVRVQVPGDAPILTWGYTHFGSPRDGRFVAMFAPRLLVSPNLVARPGGRALGYPCRWLYARDVDRKAQLQRPHPERRHFVVPLRTPARTAPRRGRRLTGQHPAVPDALLRWLSGGPGPPLAGPVTPKPPAGYMRGPPEVYARYIRLLAPAGIAQISVALVRDPLAGIG